MRFTSLAFMLFLAIVFIGFYALKKRQWQFLLLMSFGFYFFSGWQNLIYISLTIVSTYFCAGKIAGCKSEDKSLKTILKKKRRGWLLACLIFNFGVLAVVKYTDFLFANLGLPLMNLLIPMGISFYTFQAMGYVIDVYRGKTEAEENVFKLALFTSFFPQLVQGPISRFHDLKETLFAEHRFSGEDFHSGGIRVLFGFIKKLIIADRLMIALRALVAEPGTYQGIYVLVVMLFYAVALYADFTGGIDIAIGIAKMLGIRLAENFNRPFYAVSIADYWRRWHITMGTWFKDYVFYPLSVSRWMLRFLKFTRKKLGDGIGKKLPVYLATLIVWFVTGLWHGAEWNFIVWGLLNGAVIIISEQISPLYARFHKRFPYGETKAYKAFMIFRTFWLMCLLRTFDVYANVGLTFAMYGTIFSRFSWGQFRTEGIGSLGLTTADFIVTAVGIAVMIAAGHIKIKNPALIYIVGVFAILVFGIYGFGYDAGQFIYNRF